MASTIKGGSFTEWIHFENSLVAEQQHFELNLAVERMMRYTPDMRLVLNGLLRYDNAISRKTDDSLPYPFLHLTSRSSSKAVAPPVDDPLAVLATGFLGSRGKRDDYDEIPVFANGFPAGRG
ncbi:uncharacterized protein CDAR_218311 [Caerostris darwini]|uniref:Uncharacterized protein n=1 Tax=Caerostris darwini TaxID=1538125 RepID=A0AAV4RAY3_9ARAC|nr:uncharacterized protein CDAR_218311 [Caerostris darwini]